ncbi:hypothetical protein I350_02273 [Cryptococcus amylolentus CBS 6273]|uniref:Isomerase YbhE n=1 Tax=Cryptococcus amylolentus CBS 6273 TaxID=1296118 RepID=A0A1E3KA67_9TREE|nr:hypothetical protein I350_02273 [Cryptococcus amylolentus CBS 6273]
MPLEKRRLLISGDRSTFTTLQFDPVRRSLQVKHDYPAPYNCSWLEISPFARENGAAWDKLFALSEGQEVGEVFTFELHGEELEITSRAPTLGAPAQFQVLSDRSALALATYLGGSLALYPLSPEGRFLPEQRAEVPLEFAYASSTGSQGPVPHRQKQSHAHQVIEHRKTGLLFSCDLGSDRVWIAARSQDNKILQVVGWLHLPPGSGPRHAVISPDEKLVYVLCELSHQIHAFPLPSDTTETLTDIHPLASFFANIVPPEVPLEHQRFMDSAEIWLHPTIPNVIYASNRWQLHIAERDPGLASVPPPPRGDSIAIMLLEPGGTKVESVKHVPTGLDAIRGFRLSPDGRYAAVIGQEGGGVEVYSLGGERGDGWVLVACAREEDGVEKGMKDVVWL